MDNCGVSGRAGGGGGMDTASPANRPRLLPAAVAAFCVAGRLAGSALRHYRHFLARLTNCAVCAAGGRLLVAHVAAFPPLAERTPLFRPDGAQLGAQTGYSVEGQGVVGTDDGLLVRMDAVPFPRTLVGGSGYGGGVFVGNSVDVAVAERVRLRIRCQKRLPENFQVAFLHPIEAG